MHRSSLALVVVMMMAATVAGQSQDGETAFNAGLTHLRDGRPKMAVDEFKKAVQKDGKNPYAYKGLGLAYTALKEYGDAVSAFRKALELNPYYVDVKNDLGTALVLSGKREEGKTEFLAAFNDPTNPTPEISSRNLANAYLEERNYPEAANWYRTSISRNKGYADAYLGLADALAGLGRMEDVVGQLEAGVKECKDSSAVVAALGEAYFRVGRLAEARARLEEARRKDPAGPSGRHAADLLQKMGK